MTALEAAEVRFSRPIARSHLSAAAFAADDWKDVPQRGYRISCYGPPAPVRAVLSCGKLNDGRLPDGEMAANLEERDSQAVRSARATVPSGASVNRGSCVAGTRPAAQSATGPDSGQNAGGADERRNCDERIAFLSMTCCAIRGATALRTPPTKCAGRALFDEDATPCAPSVLSASRKYAV